ncbi:MAG: TldD/PmbA family protein [Candidatus Thorarchaeota archaeon]|jgi:PmbA protein
MEFDNLKDELLSVTDTGLKYAKSLDTSTEFEVFVSYQNDVSASISQGIVTAKDGAAAGTAVRATKGKRVGFAVASGVAPERIKLAAKEALSIINSVNVEDERFQGFADPKGAGKEGGFTKEILSIGSEDLIKSCEEIIEEAIAVDERVKVVSASASAIWSGYAVGNTRGILEATRSANSGCQSDVYAIEGEERRGSFHFDVSRKRLYNTEGVGKTAAEIAVGLLGAKKLDLTAKIPTIWTPVPAALFVLSSLARSTLGNSVVDGVSPLCDKIGDTIASKDLTIVDDGQSKIGLGTEAIDAEGQPQKKNSIIEGGVLKNYLFDSYYGNAFGLESTGNCARGGGIFGGGATPFESKPTVSTKWLEVKAGTKSEEDIISSIDGKAILVRDFPLGIFHSNVATGEFSCVAGSAYLVENGELKGSVEPVSIAGNYYEGYEKLRTIGSNNEALPFGIDIPTLVFDDFSIVG